MKDEGERVLSVIILTLNESENLTACISSLQPLGAAIFVVDSGSSDGTVQLAERLGAAVHIHPFENYSRQRNWAQAELPLRAEWVLHLDADERLTPELCEEIRRRLPTAAPGTGGFLLCRRTLFWNRWIRHGGHYPSYHLRLFRRDRGFCEDRLYDQHFRAQGEVVKLKHDFINVVEGDLDRWTLRHLRWARLEAAQTGLEAGASRTVAPRLFGDPVERKRWLKEVPYRRSPLLFRAFFYWCYRYFVRLGFLDGREGFVFHFLQGFWFRLYIDAQVFQASIASGRRPDHSGRNLWSE